MLTHSHSHTYAHTHTHTHTPTHTCSHTHTLTHTYSHTHTHTHTLKGLSDPEAREQCLLALLHSLPPVNFKTAVFLFKHIRRYIFAQASVTPTGIMYIYMSNCYAFCSMQHIDAAILYSVSILFLSL